MAEEPPTSSRAAAAGRGGGRGRNAAGAASDAAIAAGLPIFCRPRHLQKGSNVYSVPLWDFTARWMPKELGALGGGGSRFSSAAATGGGAAPAVAAAGGYPEGSTQTAKPAEDNGKSEEKSNKGSEKSDSEPDNENEDEETAKKADADDDDDKGSESDQSEVAWEGPLGHESRVWSRASCDGGLLLLRRLAVAPATGVGASTSSTPTPNEQEAENSGATPSAPSTYGLGVCSALFSRAEQQEGSDTSLDKRLAAVLKMREPHWAVCALRSGHFAGAVFKGQEAVVHKAIHRYTIRAKSGGSQAAADSGKKIKSAGSNLRRYGETRLKEEVRELMTDKWAKELASCELIFVSVSKRMQSTLLGTEREPFVPSSKVRKLPFMLGRPTFEVVREAYLRVASVTFAEEKTVEALTARFKPVQEPTQEELEEKARQKEEKAKQKAAAQEVKPVKVYKEEEDELYTPLHAATAAGDEAQLLELLEDGADPTARDGKGRVPFFLAPNQKIRDAYRRFRGSNEELFDWAAACVPDGITDETEAQKKEKEREKAKRKKQRQKAAKAEAKEEAAEKAKHEEEERKMLEAAQIKCDNCSKPIVSKPFSRLEFQYCTPECVAAHKRQLQAEAAMKRFGGSA